MIVSVKYFPKAAEVASLEADPMSEVKVEASGDVPQFLPEAKPAMVLEKES